MKTALVVFWLVSLPVFSQSLFEQSVDCIKWYEGLHTARHYPYVGYGHKLVAQETFTAEMSEACADSLLRADLLRRCAVFRSFRRDSLLLSVLAYNVGETRVLKSRLAEKLREGCRDIYKEYTSFRLIKGKISPVLEQRRKEEYDLLFND
jgi:lysozyme